MKRTLLLAIFFVCHGLAAQTDQELLELARSEAQLMSEAFHAGEYDTFLNLTHPKIIEGMGGREKMKALFAKGLGPGVEFVSVNMVKADKLIRTTEALQCALKQDQVMKMGGQNYLISGYLIGLSYDAGESWQFISVSNNKLSTLQQYFPELSDDLEISPQTAPKLVEN